MAAPILAVEGGAETVAFPGTMTTVCEDRCRALRDSRQRGLQRVVERDDNLAAVSALAGGHDDGVVADVRPGYAQQVAQPQARMRGEINGMGDLRRTRRLELGNVGVRPDDFRAVAGVELLDALTGVAGDLAERVNGE